MVFIFTVYYVNFFNPDYFDWLNPQKKGSYNLITLPWQFDLRSNFPFIRPEFPNLNQNKRLDLKEQEDIFESPTVQSSTQILCFTKMSTFLTVAQQM